MELTEIMDLLNQRKKDFALANEDSRFVNIKEGVGGQTTPLEGFLAIVPEVTIDPGQIVMAVERITEAVLLSAIRDRPSADEVVSGAWADGFLTGALWATKQNEEER